MGVRLALPTVGLAIGASVRDRDYDGSSRGADSQSDGALLGGVLAGMAAATLMDAALVAYEPVDEGPTVAPTVSLGRDHAFVAATRTF